MSTTKKTTKKTSAKKTNKRVKRVIRQTVTTYVPISDNIYHDGSSYRVRVTRNNERTSKNFSNKRAAVKFRNQLLGK
jgi:hemin uptake protein HemP